MKVVDYLIIGAGIVGLSVAKCLREKYPRAKIAIIDKEELPGQHASGRNSGVLHAGFYYLEDSLKAKFCRAGNKWMTNYCQEYNLPIRNCGKLVVAKSSTELAGLQTLYQRGLKNGVEVYLIDEKEARKIEPRVKTFAQALYSPSTSSVEPDSIIQQLVKELQSNQIEISGNTCYSEHKQSTIYTTKENFSAGFVINCAGVYADKIAKDFGFGEQYLILPFKGLYLYSSEPPESMRTHIYPVPNLKNPFLGVHFTITPKGHLKIGPTATPAFWREHYEGTENFSWAECREVFQTQASLFWDSAFAFRSLAFQEIQKYYRPHLVHQARKLAYGVHSSQYLRWGRPGIRAQLLDRKKKRLVMDFCLEGDHKSLHVLNAISPAFTCARPIAEYIMHQIP